MRSAVVGLALACGCFAQTPVMTFGGGKSAKQVQHEQLRNVTPPILVASERWQGEVATARIRVWADDDYRAQNRRWRRTFDDQLAYANDVLVPLLGVKLEPEYREWNRGAEPGRALVESLAALAEKDPGTDVFAVVGLTSSLSLTSASFDELGVAELGGRHLVIRGYADVEERQVFDRLFRDLSAEEREYLYKMRRRHKSAAVLLHELGHNLGAPHEAEADTLMYPSYSDRSAAFNTHSRDLMLAGVDWRLNRVSTAPVAAGVHPSLVIQIDAAGASIVGGVAISAASLDEMLRLTVADDPDTEVVIKADPSVPREAVTRVVERANAVGLHRVSIGGR